MTAETLIATLREALNNWTSKYDEPKTELSGPDAFIALARVEAELSRLREQVDSPTSDEIAESALWLDAVSEAFPDFDFSGCYDFDDLRKHMVGQASLLREALDNGDRLLSQAGRSLEAAEARCALLQQMLGAAFRECEDDLSVVVCGCEVDPEATCLAHRILALAGLGTPTDSQDCEHDYVYVSRSEDYYRCDKCDQTSKDGVYPRVGNFHPFKPADNQEDKT